MSISWRELSREPGLHTGKSTPEDDLETPMSIFDPLMKEFDFNLDAAADDDNALCERYFTKQRSALSDTAWSVGGEPGRVFCHPPGGANISLFLDRARYELDHGYAEVVVFFLPVHTDTRWWHKWVMGNEIRLIRGAVPKKHGGKFKNPMCVVVMRKEPNPIWEVFN